MDVRKTWTDNCIAPLKRGQTRKLKVMHIVSGALGTYRNTEDGLKAMSNYAAVQNELLRDIFGADGNFPQVYPVHIYSDERFELPSQVIKQYFEEAMQIQPEIAAKTTDPLETKLRIVAGRQEDTRDDLKSMIEAVDVVYLGGGSTHWLLGRLVGSGFDDVISGWTGLVCGASSGANCLGMHTMLQAWKCTFKPQCDDVGDAALWTAEISNHTSICGPRVHGACLLNGLETTNRAHYCHFEVDDRQALLNFYAENNSSFTAYQSSPPLCLADGEVFLIGRNLFEKKSSEVLYGRIPLNEQIDRLINTATDDAMQSVLTNIKVARGFTSS
jgi:hypothetical protein